MFEEVEDLASIKVASMHAMLHTIGRCAKEQNIVYVGVVEYHNKRRMPVPSPALLAKICDDCYTDLIRATGDIQSLKKLEARYPMFFEIE